MTQKKMSRRECMSLMGAGAATVWTTNLFCSRKKADKPNLLFLWTDQQRKDTMSVYGNNKIHAPNLNKLASESVVFQNPYVSQPVCTPSRSTVMTGLWPHASGCLVNRWFPSNETPCFPEIMDDPEYRTGYFGKWDLGDEIFPQHGFEEWAATEDKYRIHYSKDRDRSMRSQYHHFLTELGYKPDEEDNSFSRSFTVRLPIEHCKPSFLGMKAIDFLNRNRKSPFILYVNFLEPHPPYFGPLNDEHELSDVDLPPNFDDPIEKDEPLEARNRQLDILREGNGNIDLKTAAGWKRLICNYWGMVTQMDLSLGAILNTLEKLGLADNTIVVHTSDHGDMMGSRRLFQKSFMYQESVQVPWLMRIPWMGRRQYIIKNPVSHIDMIPTLTDLMGKPMDDRFSGKSLRPRMKEGNESNEDVYIEWNVSKNLSGEELVRAMRKAESPVTPIRTIVTPDGWKLCLSRGGQNQLFNLTKDPWETTNLYYTGGYSEIISDLKGRIYIWQKKENDIVEI